MTGCDEIGVKYISNIFEIYFSVKYQQYPGALQGDSTQRLPWQLAWNDVGEVKSQQAASLLHWW
jgi:hypothetical protein